jgi:hypothetical protein
MFDGHPTTKDIVFHDDNPRAHLNDLTDVVDEVTDLGRTLSPGSKPPGSAVIDELIPPTIRPGASAYVLIPGTLRSSRYPHKNRATGEEQIV